MSKERLIVILGPTAVGKTSFALSLAKLLDTEIISGDSMLVYRGFDIGTAKPSIKEQAEVRHWLVDILSPQDNFSAMDFQEMAQEKVAELNQKGKIPILAGGTGLYIKSLLEGYQFNAAGADAEYRRYLEELAQQNGKAYLHDMLSRVDVKTAQRLHTNDLRRVIRALEVCNAGSEQISTYKASELIYDVYVIGLWRERASLYQRINQRVDQMVTQGLEQETADLMDRGISPDCQAMQGIGYKDMALFLSGVISREDAVDNIKLATRHFAKRQLTWYRKMPYVHWYDAARAQLIERIWPDLCRKFSFL